jgi:hypothetical protein
MQSEAAAASRLLSASLVDEAAIESPDGPRAVVASTGLFRL